ncbi:MAG: hypothetical protein ACLFSW_03300 [Halobacteriales archaeon]
MEREDVDELLFNYKHDLDMAEGTLRNYRKALRKFYRYLTRVSTASLRGASLTRQI